MSGDNSTEQLVTEFLQFKGFQVEKIPETETQTPDFIFSDNNHTYLLEVKDKFSDTQALIKRKEILLRGEVYESEEELIRNRKISHVILDAEKQLSAYTARLTDFKLVWLHAQGLHPDVQMQQIEATLYGAVGVTDSAIDEPVKPCYFFSFSDFYRLSATLDGAIISEEEQENVSIKFCLNPFSARYNGLKKSKLYQALQRGIHDPIEEEAAGRAYIADWSGSRKDEKLTLQRLKEKYNKPQLIEFQPKHYSGEMIVPDDKK